MRKSSADSSTQTTNPARVAPIAHVLLISPRNKDVPFALGLSEYLGCNFYHYRHDSGSLPGVASLFSKGIVLWDVDHPDAARPSAPFFVGKIAESLTQRSDPMRTFALSDQLASKIEHLENQEHGVFISNILRKDNAVANEIYQRLVLEALYIDGHGLERFFNEAESKRQEVRLTHSSHRPVALVAIKRFLEKNGLSERLSHQVAQAADELLLNAIFDAPVDAGGLHYRKNLDRSESFALEKGETVTFSIMSNKRFFGMSIRDQFGSVDLARLIPSLYSNYQVDGYQPGKSKEGLGLNTVLESGLSLFLVSTAGKSTEAMLFFPRAKNYAEFKSTFRFLSAVWRA
jgi:hypothetical protein